MPFIDLTTGSVTPSTEEIEVCGICNKPFKHYAKRKRTPKTPAQFPLGYDEVELITCHPDCTKGHAKMEKLKARIVKTKKALHALRTAELNLQMEMILKQQLKLDDDTDEIIMVLKEKGII